MIRRKILVIILALTLILGSFSFASAAPDGFPPSYPDLDGYSWAEDYIDTMVLKGGMEGYPDGSFKPGKNITVAEFIKTTVALVDGEKDKTDSHWASGYMDAALTLQITPEGMFGRSDWDKPISREKMAVIMERTAQLVLNEKTYKDATVDMFIDKNKMCDYCKEYLAQAVSRGLINGITPNTFGPQDPANRAHAATMLSRLVTPIYRLTLTGDDLDKLMGVIEKGNKVTDFTKGIRSDWIEGLNYNYVVYNSTDLLGVERVEIHSKPDYFGSVFHITYNYPNYLYIFDKNGKELQRNGSYSKTFSTRSGFATPLKDVKYFAVQNHQLQQWEFYLNDLLTPEKAYLIK